MVEQSANTNNYESLTNSILDWAKQTENIRAIIMIGSRARTDGQADQWSDMDLLVIAKDIAEYIQTTSWIREIGNPLLTFTERAFDGSYEVRVLFEGFLDVDFAMSDPEEAKDSLDEEEVRDIFRRGFLVLLDKDDWSSYLDRSYDISRKPEISPQSLHNDIHDYWYHCVWTAKKLLRGELWAAQNCLNCYMKRLLLRMLECTANLPGEQSTDTWHNGRFIEKWASPSNVQRLRGSFSDYDKKSLSRALQHQMDFFHDIAFRVAEEHRIPYPAEEVQRVKDWILKAAEEVDKK
jgi:aminoglycoside 6-adenylyltransferase